MGLRLVLALSWFWQDHAHYEIARTALSQAIGQVPTEGNGPQLAQVRLALGRISSVQGDPGGAEHHYSEARALAGLAERSMQLQATVQEGVLTLSSGLGSVSVEAGRWK